MHDVTGGEKEGGGTQPISYFHVISISASGICSHNSPFLELLIAQVGCGVAHSDQTDYYAIDMYNRASAVVVMRRGKTASCRAGLTTNRVLLGQST